MCRLSNEAYERTPQAELQLLYFVTACGIALDVSPQTSLTMLVSPSLVRSFLVEALGWLLSQVTTSCRA